MGEKEEGQGGGAEGGGGRGVLLEGWRDRGRVEEQGRDGVVGDVGECRDEVHDMDC